MRIGLNLLFFRPGIVGGAEIFVRALVHGLDQSGRHDVFVFTSGAAARAFKGTRRTRVVVMGRTGYSPVRRALNEFVILRREVRRSDVDVLLHPGNFALTPYLGIPQVVTVLDLQHHWFPKNFSRAKYLARSLLYQLTVRSANHFVTISEFTKRDLVARYGIDETRVTAVPLGADRHAAPEQATVAAVRSKYGLPDAYFHYPAMAAPHKNHGLLLKALAKLRERGPDVHLVLTGKFTAEEPLARQIRELGLERAVHGLGFVPREDMLAILAGARAMVYPSRFEGFGLPLLEAMVCGVPVLASRAASIPEVVGEAGLLLPETDYVEWAQAMVRILEDEPLRARLVTLGTENAARFTWERSVAEMEAVLYKVWRLAPTAINGV